MAKSKRGLVFLCIGLFLFLIAGGFCVYNRIEDKNAGKAAEEILEQLDKTLPDKHNENFQNEETEVKGNTKPVIVVDGEGFCGKVIIEKLGVELPVFEDWDYVKLKKAPCRYSGNIATNDLIVAAHNYASHFGNLKKLEIGDEIIFVDAYGNEHLFAVKEIITLDGIAISDMHEGDWDFTLFTCTKGGEHRVAVRCDTIPN